MEIRAYRHEDERKVVMLWQRCGLSRSWNDPAKDIARKMTIQPELFLVGTEGEELIATAMGGYDGHRGNVYYLAVDPSYQGRGFGRTLMTETERRLLAMGCPKLNILIRSTNVQVRSFYERLGYSWQEVECLGKRLIPDV